MTSALSMLLPCQSFGSPSIPTFFQPIGRRNGNNFGVTDAELRQVLADNIRKRMKADPSLNSQPKLGARAGIGKSTVGFALQGAEGDNNVTLYTLAGLAHAFKCEPWELLIEDDATREAVLALRKLKRQK